MKRLVVLALLSVLLTGCVSQADYDELEKENAKLKKKIEKLEDEISELESNQNSSKPIQNSSKTNNTETVTPSRFFTIDNSNISIDNSATGETISYITETNAQQNPDCLIIYTIPYIENANITDYEMKITWLVTEMDDFFAAKQFENYTIYVYTPQGIDRDLTSIMLLGTNYGVSGRNRDGSDATEEPDWFVDSCVEIVYNGFEDKWLIESIEKMKSDIDDCIHYH